MLLLRQSECYQRRGALTQDSQLVEVLRAQQARDELRLVAV